MIGLVVAAMIGAGAYSQGAYWESKTSGGPIQGDHQSKMYYAPKMFKHVPMNDDGESMIVRLDKEVLYTINTKDKTYSEITFAELETLLQRMSSKSDERMAAMQEKMKNMPEEQRKMMEKMMGDKMPGKAKDAVVEVTKAGDKKTVSGFDCTKYVVTRDGKEQMELWATKEVKVFDSMRKDFDEYTKRMSALNPMLGKGYFDALRKVDGFPMETHMGDIVTVVTKIEKRSFPESEFEVPAGYTKVKSKLEESMGKMDKAGKNE